MRARRELQRGGDGPVVPREVLKSRLQSAIRADSFVAVARESGVAKGHAPDVGAAAYLRTLLRRVYTGGGVPVFDAAGAAESAVLRRTSLHASEPASGARLSAAAPEPRVPLKLVMQPRAAEPGGAHGAAPEAGQTATQAVPEDGAPAPQLRVSSSRVVVPAAPALPSEWQLRESQPPPASGPAWGNGRQSTAGGAARRSSASQPRLSSAARAPAPRRSQPGDAVLGEAEAHKLAQEPPAAAVEQAVEQPQAVAAAPWHAPPAAPAAAEQAPQRPSRGLMEPSVSAAMRKLDPLRVAAASWTSTAAPAAVRREVDLRAEGRRAVLGSLSPFDADPLHALLTQAQAAVSASRSFMAGVSVDGQADVEAPTPRVDIRVLVADSPDVDFPAFAAHTQAAVDQRAAEETRAVAAHLEAGRKAQQEEEQARGRARRGGAPLRPRTAAPPAPAAGAGAAAQPRALPFAFGSNQPRFPPPKADDQPGAAPGPGEEDAAAADVYASLGARMLGLQPPGTPGRGKGIRVERPAARRPAAGRHRTNLVAELRARMERVTAAAAAAAVTATATSLASQHDTAIRSAAAQLANSQQGEQQQQLATMHAQLIQHLQTQEERLKGSAAAGRASTSGVGLDANAVEALIRDIVTVETARAMADLRVRLLATAPSAAQAAPGPGGERGTAAEPHSQDTPARERTAMTPPWGTPQPLLGSVRGVRPSAARRAAERVLSEWHSQLEPGGWGAPTPDSSSSDDPRRPGAAAAHEAPWSSSTPSSGWSGAAPLPPRLRDRATPAGESERSFPHQSDVDLGWVELQSAGKSPPESLPSPPQDSPPEEGGPMAPADDHPWATLASPLPLTQPSLRASAAPGAAASAAVVSHSTPPATPQHHRLLRDWQMSPAEVPRLPGGPDAEAVIAGHNVLLGESEDDDDDDGFDAPYDTREHALRRAQAAASAQGGGDDAQSVLSQHSSGSEPTGVEVLQSVVARLRLPVDRG